MICSKPTLRFATAFISLLMASIAIATPFEFNDIEYWVGTGTNRAAFVIDWVEENAEPPALAWGYRWEGVATGYDMLLAIVAADDRLFAKLGDFFGTPVVYGLGYNTDGDEEFGILKIDLGGEPIETTFNESGFALSEIPDEDRIVAEATDADDYYAEGWFTGFWHYGKAASSPFSGGSWVDDGTGMAGPLADGAWDSWTFSPTFDFMAFAENPQAASAPTGQLFGDYNENDTIDAADYTVWRDTLTAAGTSLPNDPTPGTVDESDFLYWRSHFGESLGSGVGASFLAPVESPGFNQATVPEPSVWQLLATAFGTFLLTTFRQRKENE